MTEAAHGTTGEMPSWAKPQLATLTHERFSGPDWVYERKLDGERCLAFAGPDGVRLLNRNQRDITSTFPEIAGALAERRHTNLIADGEIVAFEGVIPDGEYGAGPVGVWDAGTYRNLTEDDGEEVPVEEAISRGHVKVRLEGEKLRGGYVLTRMRRGGRSPGMAAGQDPRLCRAFAAPLPGCRVLCG
jgi:ATP-dependent DNA ligase